jgi:hypothetical protein
VYVCVYMCVSHTHRQPFSLFLVPLEKEKIRVYEEKRIDVCVYVFCICECGVFMYVLCVCGV